MGKKRKSSSSLMVCVAVILISAALICGVIAYGLAMPKETDINGSSGTAGEGSGTVDTVDVSSSQSADVSSDETSSEQQTSSVLSSSQSSTSSVNSTASSDYGNAGEKDFPDNDGDKVCYLTFDDGPSSTVTSRILDTLEKYGVKATFFVTGDGNLSMLKEMYEAGHTIGLHANNHTYSAIYKSSEAYFNDLNTLSDKVYEKIGVRSKIIRFPGGSNNTVSKKYCTGIMTELAYKVQQQGYQYVDWNVDSLDANDNYFVGNKTPKDTIVKNILNSAKNKDKICVLMHDIAVKTTTADALPEIIEGLKEQGFRFEALTTESPVFHFKVAN